MRSKKCFSSLGVTDIFSAPTFDEGDIKPMVGLCQEENQPIGGLLTVALDQNAFWKRILEAFNTDNLAEIARKLNISSQSVYKWRDAKSRPDIDTLLEISTLTNSSLHWLLTGRGQKFTDDSKKTLAFESSAHYTNGTLHIYFGEAERKFIHDLAGASGRTPEEQVREMVINKLVELGLVRDQAQDGVELIFFGDFAPKLVLMRLVGEIAAGKPILAVETDEWVQVPENFAVQGRRNFVLKVRGDSMQDEDIRDGDYIICIEAPEANNGDTVVALIDGDQATVKKFYLEGKKIRLEPGNSNYSPIILSPDRVTIQGIVVGIYRRP
jgi:SOS regulatory protein LexA